jgi:hypothetical protein
MAILRFLWGTYDINNIKKNSFGGNFTQLTDLESLKMNVNTGKH